MTDRTGVAAIVLAAGSGRRFGGAKHREPIDGVALVDRAVATVAAVADLVVVVGSDPAEPGVDVLGGADRAASTSAGVEALVTRGATADTVVLVHDAAHPLASARLARAIAAAVRDGAADAVVPVMATVDTVRRLDHAGDVVEVVDRSNLVTTQTPQGFRLGALRDALAAGGTHQDDAVAVGVRGGRVATVPGEPTNVHVTTPEDLEVARRLSGLVTRVGSDV